MTHDRARNPLPIARYGTAVLSLLLVLVIGLVFSGDGAFYKWSTHRDTLRQASVFGILACGMTLVIVSGGIDLSVGSVLGLVAVTFATMSIHWRWSAWTAIPAALCIGAACGGANGVLIARLRIAPFIVTLAMMVFARGLAKLVTGGHKVSTAVANADGTYAYVPLPDVFHAIDRTLLGGNLAVVTIVFAVCLTIAGLLLARTVWGRWMFAIGGNELAARYSGVPVGAVKLLAYGFCGTLAAVAGICQAVQEQQGDPEAGATYELTAIAIVVVGGTSLTGGSGGLALTLLGTLTIGYIEKILSINAVEESWRLMLTGLIIVAAVLVQHRRRRDF